MSVRLMSKVFDYEFPYLIPFKAEIMPLKRDPITKKIIWKGDVAELREMKTTGSTCKIILLALADHANDDGKGAYPSVKTMIRKTNLKKPTVIGGLLALRFHLFIEFVGVSIRDTNNYDIIPERLVKPFDLTGQMALPPPSSGRTKEVKPLDPNHPLTTPEPFNVNERTALLSKLYTENIGAMLPLLADQIKDAAVEFPYSTWYEDAFKIAVSNNARNWKYVYTILSNWSTKGRAWIPEKKYNKPGKSSSAAQPAGEDKHDYDALRKMMLEQQAKGQQVHI